MGEEICKCWWVCKNSQTFQLAKSNRQSYFWCGVNNHLPYSQAGKTWNLPKKSGNNLTRIQFVKHVEYLEGFKVRLLWVRPSHEPSHDHLSVCFLKRKKETTEFKRTFVDFGMFQWEKVAKTKVFPNLKMNSFNEGYCAFFTCLSGAQSLELLLLRPQLTDSPRAEELGGILVHKS